MDRARPTHSKRSWVRVPSGHCLSPNPRLRRTLGDRSDCCAILTSSSYDLVYEARRSRQSPMRICRISYSFLYGMPASSACVAGHRCAAKRNVANTGWCGCRWMDVDQRVPIPVGGLFVARHAKPSMHFTGHMRSAHVPPVRRSRSATRWRCAGLTSGSAPRRPQKCTEGNRKTWVDMSTAEGQHSEPQRGWRMQAWSPMPLARRVFPFWASAGLAPPHPCRKRSNADSLSRTFPPLPIT